MEGATRTAPGCLQLFWVVQPLYHNIFYDSDTQFWIGELELVMAVEVVNKAARVIALHRTQYPNARNMPWHKLAELYAKPTKPIYTSIVQTVQEQVRTKYYKQLKVP